MRLAPVVPLAKMRRDRHGRIIGGLREQQIVAMWKASPEYALWKIRGLRESASGLREDWGKFDAERAAKVFHYNKPEGADAQMRTEHAGPRKTYIHGFASAAHARDFARHMDNQSGIHSRPWKDGNGYHVQVTHGARESMSTWSLPSIGLEVIAENAGRELREGLRPPYPVMGMTEEIAEGARDPWKEAVGTTSVGQLTRPRGKQVDMPKSPLDILGEDQEAVMKMRAANGDKDAQDRLARLAAMRRRLTPPFLGGQSEADAGMNLAGGDDAMTPEDARQWAVQGQIDEKDEPMYFNEDGSAWDGQSKRYVRDQEGNLVPFEEDEVSLPTYASAEHGGGGSAAGDAPGDAPVRKPTHKKAVGAVDEAAAGEIVREAMDDSGSHTKF